VAIIYPLGTGEETYEAVTFKSSTFWSYFIKSLIEIIKLI
jgi:hypothetical protein